MAIYSVSLADLVARTLIVPMGNKQGWFGTCTGGTTATFVDSGRYEKDDYFQNLSPQGKVRILSTTDGAAPLGEERFITDWVQSTGTGTVHDNFSAAPASGDTYGIFSEYTWDEVVEAINMAIDRAAEPRHQVLVPYIDETTTAQSSTYEYNVPVGFITIHRISMADGNGDFPDPVNPTEYRIIRAGVPKIHFIRFPTEDQLQDHIYSDLFADTGVTAGRLLRIEGLKRQERLSHETDLCSLNPSYVIYQAAAHLHESRMTGNDPDEHRTKAVMCQEKANQFLREAKMEFPINTKRVY